MKYEINIFHEICYHGGTSEWTIEEAL
jgi:hypothetical protein